MILSDNGINLAIDSGELEIDPRPTDEQFTTSAVDLSIGSSFRCWDHSKLKIQGMTHTLDLSEQKFALTANALLIPMPLQQDGTFLFPPFADKQMHILGITRERVHLKDGSR